MIKRNVLLNPGPATTTDSVKYAQVVPDICPREQEFGNMMWDICNQLTSFVADTECYTTVLFGGSGTAAVESMLSSVIGDQDKLIIINNGAYGKRMVEIAQIYGLNAIEFESSPYQPLNLTQLQSFIENSSEKVTHLAVVHNETTTGLLNDVSSIGVLCKRNGIDLLVDAMSSYAAIPIQMSEMNISYLTASSNKNLQGMAGVSFVIANKEKIENTKHTRPRNFYLNLYQQYKYFSENRQTRFTPPVQTLYALNQAIIEAKNEGISTRYARYSNSWEVLIAGLDEVGLSYLIPKDHHSRIITAICEPEIEQYDFNSMHDYLYSRGFTIYPGKVMDMATFRVANIGEIDYTDIQRFLEVLKEYLCQIGWKR